MLLNKQRCCSINEPHKQYIKVDIIFNYIFHVSGTCVYLSPKTHLSGVSFERYFLYFSKNMFLKSKMNVVKYDVYLDMLLVGLHLCNKI